MRRICRTTEIYAVGVSGAKPCSRMRFGESGVSETLLESEAQRKMDLATCESGQDISDVETDVGRRPGGRGRMMRAVCRSCRKKLVVCTCVQDARNRRQRQRRSASPASNPEGGVGARRKQDKLFTEQLSPREQLGHWRNRRQNQSSQDRRRAASWAVGTCKSGEAATDPTGMTLVGHFR